MVMGRDLSGQTLIIRADANSKIGAGHVMRCLALAQAWQERGGDVVFAGQVAGKNLAERIKKNGCKLQDVGIMEKIDACFAEQKTTWVALDGYHFSLHYQKEFRGRGIKLLVIDDYAHLDEYDADLLLNQNIGAEMLSYKISPSTCCLFGPGYAMLRQEFWELQQDVADKPEDASRLLVTLGGADAENVTLKVIGALKLLDAPELEVKIVAGPANPHRADLERELFGASFPWQLLSSVANMAPLMEWADLAVSAAGSTCWELCCMGVPAAVIIVAENQKRVAQGLARSCAAINCGWSYRLQDTDLARTLTLLLNDPQKRAAMGREARLLVDGHGAKRVVEKMMPQKLTFREVEPADCRRIFTWANDPVIRAASFQTEQISWEEHQRWFYGKLADENAFFWLVTTDDQEVGQVRYDLENDAALISVSVDSRFRKLGLGSRVIREACDRFFSAAEITQIRAEIRQENRRSIKAFAHAGFVREKEAEKGGVPALYMVCQRASG